MHIVEFFYNTTKIAYFVSQLELRCDFSVRHETASSKHRCQTNFGKTLTLRFSQEIQDLFWALLVNLLTKKSWFPARPRRLWRYCPLPIHGFGLGNLGFLHGGVTGSSTSSLRCVCFVLALIYSVHQFFVYFFARGGLVSWLGFGFTSPCLVLGFSFNPYYNC